jgi:hypothetical protein
VEWPGFLVWIYDTGSKLESTVSSPAEQYGETLTRSQRQGGFLGLEQPRSCPSRLRPKKQKESTMKTKTIAIALTVGLLSASIEAQILNPPGVPPPPYHVPPFVFGPHWVLTMTQSSTGQIDKWAFPTKEACEAAIQQHETKKTGYNGHCDPSKPPPE